MPTIQELQEKYHDLNEQFDTRQSTDIDASCLLAFDYEFPQQEAEIVVDTDEFTAVCPWTDLPDFGTLIIKYVPDKLCLELKSLKYYLLSYTRVGIVQEHAANRLLDDLVEACQPRRMTITLDYKVRGGLHTTVTVNYEQS